MQKKLLRSLVMWVCLVMILSGLDWAHAEETTFKERLQKNSDQFDDTWLNRPRKRHTDSSTTAERQAEFQKRADRFDDTWLNRPRKRHTDSSTTAQRQANFKKRCAVFNDTWLNGPRRQRTDSSYLEAVSAKATK